MKRIVEFMVWYGEGCRILVVQGDGDFDVDMIEYTFQIKEKPFHQPFNCFCINTRLQMHIASHFPRLGGKRQDQGQDKLHRAISLNMVKIEFILNGVVLPNIR